MDVQKESYTITASTGPLEELNDELLDSLASALEKSRRLIGTVVSGDMLSRTLSVRASVDAAGVGDAVVAVVSELGKAFARAGLKNAELVDFAVMRDLAEDEYASARDDVVGTPDVAARLGISRQRIAQLVEQRGRFPRPIATVRGTHVWRWGDIADWIAAGARDMRRKAVTETRETSAAAKRVTHAAAKRRIA